MPHVHAIATLGSLVALVGGMSACADDELLYSNKWRIECSGDAQSDGAIQLRITPEGGEPTTVTVQIEDGRSENGVARDIRDALRTQLPPGTYDVETDDGEDVLLKKNLTEPTFAVQLVSSSVEDVRIRLDRE